MASETAQEITPDQLFQRAAALHQRGRIDLAITAYRKILQMAPGHVGGWGNLGVALRTKGDYEAAVVAYKRALEIVPGDPGITGNLGNALKDIDRLDEALAAHRSAAAALPDDFNIRYNHGIALREAARYEEALAELEAAIALKPDAPHPQWDRAIALLHLGRFEEGWAAYEARWKTGDLPERPKAVPRWQGEVFEGKRLLVFAEQGFGDSILTSRLIPLIKERAGEGSNAGRVILECKAPLQDLFSEIAGIDRMVEPGEAVGDYDLEVPIMSLPGVFNVSDDRLPPPAKLHIPDYARKKARVLLRQDDRFKVGIVWSGSVTFKGNRKRAVGVENFLPFAEVPGVDLYALQKGPRSGDLEAAGAGAVVTAIGEKLDSFAETAAVIEALDLVIMTDSSVAHLAGSLGRPIWNLLNKATYWLYRGEGETTPWYPSMKLFRQKDAGAWEPVFERVKDELAEAVAAKRAGNWPR
ncbi:tetratricopeptide repeat protein [Denitrobaculum tricleocarpae]|uniref:Tetratricopeptide repeat protein n=1 Tax=Denitrobaculum tricleocarpae TaxID=2591009 RepID=A0A545TQV6_9PROT|nr:tetratricopeptide repeat protein [Denitrobaculum tricleocarpae]TQV79598.1 tetratricopeptide repeat protein [Denitrobaculum tricleocarpae]